MNHIDDCFAGARQDFLICVTVHKAAETGVPVGELYVKISLDKMSKNTKTQANSENPFFNEYFVFEFHCTLTELLRLTVLFELKRYMIYKKNVLVGELMIDLHSVWNQPNHSYFKRWGRLELPIGEHVPERGNREMGGYLQIDLAIVSQHSALKTGLGPEQDGAADAIVKWPTHHDFDDIKGNLLEDTDSDTLSNIRYFVSFFRGIFTKKSSYLIQVSFAGFKGKTHVAKNTMTPVWNQEISFAWVYPSLAQRFLILVIMQEHLQWKCVAEYEMSFEDIAFNDKPSFGPTYLHLYDPVSPMSYVGRLLMELRSETLAEGQPTHVLISQSVPAPTNWTDKPFIVEFLPILGDQIHSTASQYKFMVKLAENVSNVLEGPLKTPLGKFHSMMHTKCFRQESPFHSCLLDVNLPDNRIKFEADFFMIDIVNYIRSELAVFKIFQIKFPDRLQHQAKCLKHIINSTMEKILDSVQLHRFDYDLGVECTTWDVNRQQYLLEYFKKVPRELRALRQKLKSSYPEHLHAVIGDIVNDLHRVIGEISALSNLMHVQDDWPELLLILHAGGKEIGVCRLNAKHFLSLQKREANQANNHCWKVKSFLFKSPNCLHNCVNCGCNVGIVLGCVSIVLERERHEFFSCIAGEWASPEPMAWLPNVVQTFFRCHIYVHQAKVRPSGMENRIICDGHVRVVFAAQAAETHTTPGTCSPIWDAVITIKGLTLPGSISWYLQNPPMIGVELFNSEYDAVGSGHIVVSVITDDNDMENSRGDESRCWGRSPVQKMKKLRNVSPPPLKWVSMAKNGMVQAEVLMSVEFKELVGDSQAFGDKQPELIVGIPPAIRPNVLNYILEVIFIGLRNYTKMGMTMAGKRRAKVIMADLVLSSGLSTSRVRNSINFLVAYASGVVSLPDQQEYWPAMIATDVMVNTFCNESTLGAALIPPSPSYLQKERRCRRRSGESSAATSTVIVDGDDDLVMEETEDDKEEPPAQVDSYWKRIKIALGLRTAAYANKQALKYEEHTDASDLLDDSRFTWWTKFYNSMHLDPDETAHLCKHRLVIYTTELEQLPQFSFLQDWAVPVPLVHGVKLRKHGPPKEDVYATLKLQIKLTPCQCTAPDEGGGGGDGDMLRPLAAAINPRQQTLIKAVTDVFKITVRVYIVQGLQMRPRDWMSDSDSYVRLTLGGKMVSDRAHYVPNQSNPVFGRFFELNTSLPADHILEVAIFDHDKRKDQIIGYTRIDLEDRWQTKHRATVGIPQEYSHIGYNQWRAKALPSQLLNNLCQQRGIQPPYFYGNVIEVDGMLFGDETIISKSEELQERLSLTALKNLDKLPSFGYKLVPEHVETRSLYRDDSPGVVQGKIQMWIELYEQNMFIPPPVEITPMPPVGYEVRVVVKNLRGIQFGDKNIFGKLMSDIYVIGWCQDANKYQATDIHYRSFAGEAAFNWRMIFALKYAPNEDMMVIRRKGGLQGEEIELKRPPIIYLQIWDKDVVTRDEYLGALEVNLSNLPLPYHTERSCQPFPRTRQRINLFSRKTVHGWFPLHDAPESPNGAANSLGGKIELQLDVCTEAEASNLPAGLGHQPPMALEAPKRPETSFNPLTHPFKSAHLILWPVIRKYVFIGLFVIFVCMGLTLFFANLPNKLMSIPFK
ncbi:fer-1-like protein 6 isoform X1 [Drosophila novamexicana]|uniref:fer-1-like protein 6 isoform X1 n=1 Tax=Drosophila novamexicana TaxID=47314 RepID=UPI0011E5BBC1|nr:fer-1-like protein 6 isoform X1 [Drosophila novamexicana]